jgi:hypothetical protein
MSGGMDLLQLLDRDLGVNLGGREFGLAKELLDKADIRAAFPGQARSSRIENVDSERGGPPTGPTRCLNFRRIIGALRIRRAQSLQLPPALHIPIPP